MPETIRMVLVDDHEFLRAGVRAVLSADPAIEVVGEAETGSQALKLAADLAPDLMLLDLTLGDMSGLELARELHAKFPNVRSLVLSMHGGTGYMRQAKRAGALGYVVKGGPSSSELTQAICAVSAGGTYFPHLPEYDDCPLTPREREVLVLICKGFRNKEISELLGIGVKVVETHRLNMRQKLGLDTVGELIEYAREQGIYQD